MLNSRHMDDLLEIGEVPNSPLDKFTNFDANYFGYSGN